MCKVNDSCLALELYIGPQKDLTSVAELGKDNSTKLKPLLIFFDALYTFCFLSTAPETNVIENAAVSKIEVSCETSDCCRVFILA